MHWHVFRNGDWKLADCIPAWDGNYSNGNYISYAWQGAQGEKILVAVNYSPDYSQCFVKTSVSVIWQAIRGHCMI